MHFWDYETDEDAKARRLGPVAMVRRMLPLFRPHRAAFIKGGLLLAASVLAELAAPLILRQLIDREIVAKGDPNGVVLMGVLYIAVAAAGTWCAYRQIVVMARAGLRIVADLKGDLFRHLLSLSAAYFDKNPPGQLMARVESDSERLRMLFSNVSLAILRNLALVVGTVGVMVVADAAVTLLALGVLVPVGIISVSVLRYTRTLHSRVRRIYAKLSTFITEYVQTVPILQVFGHVERARGKLAERNSEKLQAEVRAYMFEYGFWAFLITFEVVVVMVVVWVASGKLFNTAMTVGTLVLFIEYIRRMFFPIAMFIEQLGFVQRAFASADRVFEVLDTPSLTPDRGEAEGGIPDDWRELKFNRLTFSYDGRRRALDEVSLSVRRGEKVALVGPSGGGKTTLTNLLFRFYEPSSGSISLDDRDIREFRQREWRRSLGLVLQDIHLFPGTVGDNLRAMHRDIPQEALERAVAVVKGERVIERLPEGYETMLAEGGINLSMGERQLISFARAVVHDPAVLVLDEATSSIDPVTERRLQESVDSMLAGRTSIVVAHRLATVVSADRILVLNEGRVVEEGTHAELYAGKGLYRDLFDLQFRSDSGGGQ